MINLLPPEQKKALFLERNKKLIIVIGNMTLISLVCFVLVLFALKFYILEYVSYKKTELENTAKRYQTPELTYYKSLIQKYNSSLIKVENFYKTASSVSEVLKTISGIERPEGLYLTNLAVEKLKDETGFKVTAAGKSKTRDDLLTFKNNIEYNEMIANAYFPPEDWVKPRDITFYFNFEINPSKE